MNKDNEGWFLNQLRKVKDVIVKFWQKTPIDKQRHFLIGGILSFLFMSVDYLYGFLLLCALAGAKELIWDKLLGKGTAEWKDFFYSIAIGIIVLTINLLFQ